MDIQLARGAEETEDGGDLLLQGADAIGVDMVSEELDGRLDQHALVQVNHQLGVVEAGEDLPEVLIVFLDGPAAYQDVVYITEETEDIRNVT